MGFIDLAGVSEENIFDVRYKFKNITIKLGSAKEHEIDVEVELELFARVFENKDVNIIQDMYSPSMNITFNENRINTMVNMQNVTDTLKVREKVKLDDIEYTNILDVQVIPRINETNILNGRVNLSGDLNLDFILTNSEQNSIISARKNVPIEFNEEIEGITDESKIRTDIEVAFKEFLLDGLEVTAKVDLNIEISAYNLETINVINSIEESGESVDNPYSMVIYFVKQGDTLWKIAKKYRSTVDDIVRVNNIENPNIIHPGMQLFIPKYTMTRTEISM